MAKGNSDTDLRDFISKIPNRWEREYTEYFDKEIDRFYEKAKRPPTDLLSSERSPRKNFYSYIRHNVEVNGRWADDLRNTKGREALSKKISALASTLSDEKPR